MGPAGSFLTMRAVALRHRLGAGLAGSSTVDYGDGRYDEHFPGRDRFHGLRKVVFDFEHAFVNATAGYLTDLREICHEFHPDAMVHDPAVIAGAIMGISDGLPAATINISVLSIEGRNVGPFGLGLLPPDGPLGRLRNRAMLGLVDHVIFGDQPQDQPAERAEATRRHPNHPR
jgi:hypothetical protein